ncbi:hypothetical protein [Nannocystis sp. SCPEA4]|uniref:monooxygenase n=1 Tax=Nannocystis sp. SCPEA4 TaxID=2996787 RepID=UPI0022711912|nr:hypothetical protein [Nannocystis sp. SCPEA4]MCY1056193.1 hypothetical protein [Nannocystis sp. SCPEA4]
MSTAVLAACGSGPAAAPGAPGYRQLHEKIFSKGCANDACHSGEKGIADLTFADLQGSYDSLIEGVPANGAAAGAGLVRVKPGDAAASFLYMKLTEHGPALTEKSYGAAMPLSGIEPPGEKSLAAIKAWIDAGAPMDGDDFEADLAEHHHEANYVECEATAADEMQKCFKPTPTDGEYLRIYTPPLEIPAGREIMLCSEIDLAIDEPLLIDRAAGQQMNGGHHIAVFTTLAPTGEYAPLDCDDVDMSKLRFVMGAGGAGGLDTTLPDGVGVRVLPGQRLLVQSHYINTTDKPTTVMDAVDLALTTEEESPTLADSFAVIDSDFEIPAKTRGFERVKECRLEQDYDIHMLLGHTHERGVMFRFDLLRGDAEPELLYYATDGKLLRSNPEIKLYHEPLQFKAGDRLRMTCRWDNDDATAVGWPEEMCVTFMYYSPGEGFLTCDSADETPVTIGGGDDKCRKPGDEGNEKGVGKFCSVEGGECVGNGTATLCLENFDSFSNYCTLINCQSDADCGAGAYCAVDPAGSACVPNDC